MKRNEMERKILSVIESFFHSNDPKYGFLAEYIMEEIEEAGMLPPSYVPKDHGIAISGIKSGEPNGFNIQINKWEEEDE